MGPPESRTRVPKKQGAGRRKGAVRKPRARWCLLKGCEQHFHPLRARQRYCSPECREGARKRSEWKAQQKYRTTRVGKQKRNGQSRHHRERVKRRKAAEPEPVSETAGNHSGTIFSSTACDRPECYERFARQRRSPLQRFCCAACRRAPERFKSGSGAGNRRTFNPEIWITSEESPNIQPVDATGVSSARQALGAS